MDVFRNSCGSFLDQSEFETSSVFSSFIRNVFGSFGFSWLDFRCYLECCLPFPNIGQLSNLLLF